MKTVAIVNPTAGRGRARRSWPRLLEASGGLGSQVITWWTEGRHHAESLAARARREGFHRVVAVGGDGTLFEVANGLWWEPQGEMPSLGVVPWGTGCDYVRNFPLGANPQEQLRTALSEATMAVTAGVFRCQNPGGTAGPRIFLNHLGVGFDAEVIARFQRRHLPLRGKLPYFLAGLRELVALKFYRFRGTINSESLDTTVCILVMGLGRFFGGGLMITPQASVQASQFQVVWGTRLSRWALLEQFGRLLWGKPLLHPAVHTTWARKVTLSVEPPARVEAEGELVGQTPLEVEAYPEAFQVAQPRFLQATAQSSPGRHG
jgi:diacylglycerol kinase (ATP)